MNWFAVFLNLFAMGMGATLIAVPYRQIGKYYFSFHSTMLLLLAAIAVLVGQPWTLLVSGTAYMKVVAGLSLSGLTGAPILIQTGDADAYDDPDGLDQLLARLPAASCRVSGGRPTGRGRRSC